jgi:hypothetical protein
MLVVFRSSYFQTRRYGRIKYAPKIRTDKKMYDILPKEPAQPSAATAPNNPERAKSVLAFFLVNRL